MSDSSPHSMSPEEALGRITQLDFDAWHVLGAELHRLRGIEEQLETAHRALEFYGERRNYQNALGDGVGHHDLAKCPVASRDSYDGNGPGARARAALNPASRRNG